MNLYYFSGSAQHASLVLGESTAPKLFFLNMNSYGYMHINICVTHI